MTDWLDRLEVGLPMTTAELSARRWDVVVVGGGHNGLTAAAYVARAGRSVLVLFHGEILPEYLWDRRIGYRTGVDGVHLCGAGTHPGGAVTGANGRNAARVVLADLAQPA